MAPKIKKKASQADAGTSKKKKQPTTWYTQDLFDPLKKHKHVDGLMGRPPNPNKPAKGGSAAGACAAGPSTDAAAGPSTDNDAGQPHEETQMDIDGAEEDVIAPAGETAEAKKARLAKREEEKMAVREAFEKQEDGRMKCRACSKVTGKDFFIAKDKICDLEGHTKTPAHTVNAEKYRRSLMGLGMLSSIVHTCCCNSIQLVLQFQMTIMYAVLMGA